MDPGRHFYKRTRREANAVDSVGGWLVKRQVRRGELIHEMDSPYSSVQRFVVLICDSRLASRVGGVRDLVNFLQIMLNFLKLVNFVNFANLTKFRSVTKAYRNRNFVNFANLVIVFAKSFDMRCSAWSLTQLCFC